MVTDWDIYSEPVFEVQRFLWKQGIDVQYDWLAPWPFLLAGLSLPPGALVAAGGVRVDHLGFRHRTRTSFARS